MRVLTAINQYHAAKDKPLILGLGNFDGLHLGHQALIQHVIREAKQSQGIPALMTFRMHPQHVLHPEKKSALLFSGPYKLFLFAQAGIELCFWLDFTAEFSQTDPVFFVREWLCRKLGVREVCMGFNARFGRGRKGDGALMGHLSRELGFKFSQIPPVKAAGETVSSSRIRTLAQAGNLKEVEACLGRPFSLLGEVVPGAGRGKPLGFPTANLKLGSTILPPRGVYAVWVRKIERLNAPESGQASDMQPKSLKWVRGGMNIGFRPTFEKDKQDLQMEVFLLDYQGPELYGETLEVVFAGQRLREEKAFSSGEALARQIQADCRKAGEVLERFRAPI